ncbi:MAG: hypothetical protein FJW39_02495 [Acidobacteria bacterium]|nr:hypothetical protein [Acidobacteriota bacterium]
MSNNRDELIRFGSYRVSPAARTLRHADEVVPLAPKTFDLLLVLAGSRGRVVTKRELMDELWKDVFVEEASLLYQVSTLRKALGEEGAGWVETVPRVGYRFSAPVEFQSVPPDPVVPPPPQPAAEEPRRPRWLRLAVLAGGLALVAAAAFVYMRMSQASWARNEGLPLIASLTEEGRFCAAFSIANRVQPMLGEDPRLADLRREVSRTVALDSEPQGAEAFYKDLRSSEREWQPLGRTPLPAVQVPRGYFRLRFEKEGFESSYGVMTAAAARVKVPLYPKEKIPSGMVPVPQAVLDLPRRFAAPEAAGGVMRFMIDRHEVTNRQFKEFVDAGAYRDQKFWKHPFNLGGKTLSWEQAMAALVDATGRPGPSTWEAGTFAPGRENDPVSGVSWYEAAAYAEYAGKQLPTAWHWYAAARLNSGTWVLPSSNFSGKGLARVGEYQGEGPYGTYDMAGNVKEWCWNGTDEGRRVILGGGWSEPAHMFTDPDARPPFDRSALNGFRCALYSSPPPASWLGAVRPILRNLDEKPASDEVYGAYRRAYAYDSSELAASIDRSDDSQPYWRRERITYTAPYGAVRVPALLFLPKNSKAPYETIVYYPGAGALNSLNSETVTLEGWARLEYLLRAGRAVMYPVYQGTYERSLPRSQTPLQRRDMIVQQVVDLRRAVDYLQTRPDIAADRLAFFGVSFGASLGPIQLALENRLKSGVLADGGLSLLPSLPEVNPLHFAPRVRVPVLMLNGKNDYVHPVETSQKALFRLFGTPEPHKKHVLFDAAHEVVAVRTQVIREMLDWLDRYQGPVRRN